MAMPPLTTASWLVDYIGVPFADRGRSMAGADCRGLAYLILERECGVRVPEPEELYASTDPRCPDLPAFVAETLAGAWVAAEAATPFSILLFQCAGVPAHVGVALGDGWFVHTRESRGVHISHLDQGEFGETAWRPRLLGAYRYVG